MTRVINIKELYKKAFGYVGPPYPTFFDTSPRVVIPEGNDGLQTFDSQNESSVYGVTYFMPLKIEDKSSSDGWYTIPYDCLISLSGSKICVKSQMIGNKRRGTVKESVALGDYVIDIRGILINNQTNDEPQADLQKLRYICEELKCVKVSNRLLAYFNIEYIYIESCQFPAVEGMQHCQPFTISALSDEPVELIIKNRPVTV